MCIVWLFVKWRGAEASQRSAVAEALKEVHLMSDMTRAHVVKCCQELVTEAGRKMMGSKSDSRLGESIARVFLGGSVAKMTAIKSANWDADIVFVSNIDMFKVNEDSKDNNNNADKFLERWRKLTKEFRDAVVMSAVNPNTGVRGRVIEENNARVSVQYRSIEMDVLIAFTLGIENEVFGMVAIQHIQCSPCVCNGI